MTLAVVMAVTVGIVMARISRASFIVTGSGLMATETVSYHAIDEANIRAEADALRTLILCAILFVVAAVGGGLAIILSLVL